MSSAVATARPPAGHHAPAEGRPWDAEEPYAWRRDRLPKLVATLPRRPDNLGSIVRDAVVAAGLLHVLRPDDPGVLAHLRDAARAAGAAARLLGPDAPESVTVTFAAGGAVEVPRAAPRDLRFDRTAFTEGFHAAMAARDGEALDALAAIPDEALDAGGTGEAPYVAPRVRALRGLRRRDATFPDALSAWLRATDPAALPDWAVDHALDTDATEVALVYALRRDAAPGEFDAALSKALERHRAYWTRTDEARSDFRGLLALGPLAQACLSRDMGGRAAVRSAYLPMSVVDSGAA